MGPRGLAQKLDQAWHKRCLLPRGKRLLVAVSGGADSVALLRLLVDINRSDYWRWTLIVAHVSHGIRGRSGTADARFVQSLAEKLGLPHVQRTLRLGKSASEDEARAARLAALAGMVKAKKAVGVVMAHHADDQAETVVMRILRGTGVEGLAAMGAVSRIGTLAILRPLLTVRRAELRACLGEIGQRWREDETNASGRYVRNRVRSEVLPAMEAVAPGCASAIGRLAHLAGETWAVVEQAVDAAWAAALVSKRRKRTVLRREVLRGVLPLVCAEVLRRAIVALGGSSESFERVEEAVRVVRGNEGGKRVEMVGGVVILVGREVAVEI
jgi:tRNA(Ile)-lysidine synthetase-like protein